MDFGNVLKRAWQIIWKFKVLWLFGILASCGQASSSGGSNSSYQFSGGDGSTPSRIEQFFNQLDPTFLVMMIIVAIVIVLVLIILAILLGTVGRVGLISGTLKAEQGATKLTFGELWRDGLSYFWRVFGLNLLIGVVIFLVILAIMVPGIILTVISAGVFALCLIPFICLLIPVIWAVTVVVEQANIALVVENLGITAAIKRGWQVVRENLGNIFVMSLILVLGVGLLGGAIIGLPMLLVAAPMIAGYASGTAQAIQTGWIVTGIFFLIYLPFLLVFSGILRSYTSSAWTLTFLRLTSKPATPLIETSGIPGDIIPPPA